MMACQSNSNPHTFESKCSKGHSLRLLDFETIRKKHRGSYRFGWRCDECDFLVPSKDDSYHCAICQYDLCNSCYLKRENIHLSSINKAQESELRVLKEKESKMMQEIKRLKGENEKYQEEQKENALLIAVLEEKVKVMSLETMDPSKYMQWDWTKILMWISSVENGRFKKYELMLKQSLSEADIAGDDLSSVDQMDIKIWGIKNFKDQKCLYHHIQGLIRPSTEEAAQQNEDIGKGKEGDTTFVM